VHHWFVAGGTLEEKLKGIIEGESLATRRLAAVKFVVFLVLKPVFQLFENVSLQGCDEPSKLVRLKSPVEDEPTCFFVAELPNSHEGVIVESIECLTNQVEAYLCLIRDIVVCDLVNSFEDIDDPYSVLTEQCGDLLQRIFIHKKQF